MPIFAPDFTKVEAGFPVYEKGRYRVKVTKKTPLIEESKPDAEGNTKIKAGVRYALEMGGQYDREGNLDDTDAGKQVSSFTCWVHSDGGWKFSKPFLMAACGFAMKEEAQANVDLFQAHSWELDGDVGANAETFVVGDGWDLPIDRFVDVTLKKSGTTNKETGEVYENQDFGSWGPVE